MSDFNYSDGCDVIADLIVEVAPPAICALGTYSSGGLAVDKACGPWLWLNTKPGYKQAIKLAADQGCEVVVKYSASCYEIVVREARRSTRGVKQAARDATRTYRALNTPAGANWLLRRLGGY